MEKPLKPYPDFPLTPHAKGWCKKYKGKVRMVCGHLAPDKALEAYALRRLEWDREDAPDAPPPPPTDEIALVDLADLHLESKKALVVEGSIANRTYLEAREAILDFCKVVGPTKPCSHLGPSDFQKHRLKLAERFGVHRRKKFMIVVRGLFKWGAANGKISRAPLYGTEYQLPSKRDMRRREAEREQAHGKLLFTLEEVKALLANCDTANMKAMILLALNGGYGQNDLAELPLSVLDLQSGVVEYRRTKTAIRRRVFLWPETIEAVREAIKARPKAAEPQYANRTFLTAWGNPYIRDRESKNEAGEVRSSHKDQIGMTFLHLCRKAGAYRTGRGFSALRHTFRTYADEVRDHRAAALIMGHEVGDVADFYVEGIGDDRLKAICDHVRKCVLGVVAVKTKTKARKKTTKKSGKKARVMARA